MQNVNVDAESPKEWMNLVVLFSFATISFSCDQKEASWRDVWGTGWNLVSIDIWFDLLWDYNIVALDRIHTERPRNKTLLSSSATGRAEDRNQHHRICSKRPMFFFASFRMMISQIQTSRYSRLQPERLSFVCTFYSLQSIGWRFQTLIIYSS